MYEFRQSGIVLIEAIIVVIIGLLLISVLMEMYLTCHNSLKLQTTLYNIQDNAKTAISILTTEIHQAGMIGCARLTNDFPITSYQEYRLSPENKLMGTKSNQITIRYAGYPNAYLNVAMQDGVTMYVDQDIHFSAGDILLVSNCNHAEVFEVEHVKSKSGMQKITSTTPLHNKYEKFSEVSRFVSNTFYIAKTDRKNNDGSKVYALYLEDVHRRKTELVSGINQMRITYTINQAGLLKDVSADEVIDWAQVVGVAVDLDLYTPLIKKTWHMYSALQG